MMIMILTCTSHGFAPREGCTGTHDVDDPLREALKLFFSKLWGIIQCIIQHSKNFSNIDMWVICMKKNRIEFFGSIYNVLFNVTFDIQ
jgi:hypothetical protein